MMELPLRQGRRTSVAILIHGAIIAAVFGMLPRGLCAQQRVFPAQASRAQRQRLIPPKEMRLPQENPLPGYTVMHVSPYGSDLNDGTGWGTAKASIEGALRRCTAAGVVCRILVAPGRYVFSSTIHLPVNTRRASCRIEGASSAGAQGTGNNDLFDQGMTLLEYTGSGVAVDQTFSDAAYQNAMGCQLRHLALDGRNASSGAIGIRFGGTLNFTLDDVQVSNFSRAGDIGIEVLNSAPGIFTEQWRLNDVRISNDATGVLFTRSGGSATDFGHGYADIIWNEFSGQTGLRLSDAHVYDSVLINNGNFSGNSCSGIRVSGESTTGAGNDWVYWGAENDGNCTRFSVSGAAGFDVSGLASGTGSWRDSGEVIFEGSKSGKWALPNLSIGSGAAVTSSGAGGVLASVGSNGISAGVIDLNDGTGTHIFAIPYDSSPICTASGTAPVKLTVTPEMVSVTGTGNDTVTWICTPGAN